MSHLPPREFLPNGAERNYLFFGYPSHCIHHALTNDDAECLAECQEAGYLNPQCETLDGYTMIQFAERKSAAKCVQWLKENGYK